jgi:biopolymer transport protein ExbD
MDMTPAIDVSFQLLIFFMIVNTYTVFERAAKLDLPVAYQAVIAKDVAKERMIINIERDGRIVVFGKRVNIGEFREHLRKMGPFLRKFGETSGQAPIVVRGDKDCEFRHVKEILAAIYDERFEKVMFAAYQRKEPEKEK